MFIGIWDKHPSVQLLGHMIIACFIEWPYQHFGNGEQISD